MKIAIDQVTATSARVTQSETTGLAATVQMQFSIRPDFKNCVCPIIPDLPYGQIVFYGLNQNTTYYARAREVITLTGEEPWSPVVAFRTLLANAQNTAPNAITHAPAMVVVPNPVLEWAAANEQAGYPVENLGYDAPVAWRSSNAAAHSFSARMAPEPIDTIALLMSNAPEAAQVQIRAGDTQAQATGVGPLYTQAYQPFRASANLPGRPGYHALIRLPAPKAYAWWEVAIACTVPGNVFHLEHAVFGLNRATKNHAIDKSETPIDMGQLTRSRSGAPQRALGARMRKVDFEIAAMTEAQYETVYSDLGWRVGETEPLLVVPNSKANSYLHDRILYGTLSSSKIVNPASHLYTRSFTIESLLP